MQANTAEAAELGVFGAPTFIVGGERFWGQDRLPFVDRALAKASAESTEDPSADKDSKPVKKKAKTGVKTE